MAVKKTKSKAWYTIIAPEMFGSRELGKTTAVDPDYLVGRKITVSAMEAADNYSKYYLKFKVRVDRVEGDKVFTSFDGSECMRDYISRMVLRHVRRIDTVQDLRTKDGKNVRVKSLAIVSKKMNSSVVKVVRRRIQEDVRELVENAGLQDLVSGIIDDNMKIRVLDDIRKIYPVRTFEFRKTEVLA